MTLKLTDPAHQLWGETLPSWSRYVARILSMILMAIGVYYWADMLGVFSDSALGRNEWQHGAFRVVLGCSFLIASVGLWQLNFWGIVVWVLSAVGEILAIAILDDFSRMPELSVAFQAVSLIAVAAAGGWLFYVSKKGEDKAHM